MMNIDRAAHHILRVVRLSVNFEAAASQVKEMFEVNKPNYI